MQHDKDSNNKCSITVIDKQNNKTQWKRDGNTVECKIKHRGQRQTRLVKSLQATSSPAVQHYNSCVVQVAVQ